MTIKSIAVLGAGQMGSGIAQIAAKAGYKVIMCDIKEEFCKKGIALIANNFSKQVAKEKMTAKEVEAALANIFTTVNIEEVASVDFVIEAAPENLELKHDLFIKLGKICKPEAILATNTSSMSITAITKDTERPERCIGMHFFFPVQAMKLIEMIRSEYTDEKTVDAVRGMAATLNKKAVLCQTDTPGFIVNRCLFAFMLEAISCYEEGVASLEDIDTAIKFGLNHPLGPFEMMDLSGIDTFPHVTETLESLSVTTWKCPESIKQLVKDGKFGRKSGEGWYKY